MTWGHDIDLGRTIESACDGLVAVALLDYKLDVRVLACDAFDVCRNEGARVSRRGQVLAELDDDLAGLGEERSVSVGGQRAHLSAQDLVSHGAVQLRRRSNGTRQD